MLDQHMQILRGPAAIAELSAPRGISRRERLSEESYLGRVLEAGMVFDRARSGSLRAKADLEEAMSRSDFPLLFGDFVGYTLARQYANTPTVWQEFAARTTAPDFKDQKVLDISGGRAVLDKVPELNPYKRRSFSESEFSYTLAKYGNAIAWSWEANIDDRIGVFEQAPAWLGQAARYTEDYLATVALLDTDLSGPASWLGTPATTALTRANLEAAIQTVMSQVDSDGIPQVIGTPILMVPRALALTAANILNTVETVTGTVATTGEARVQGNGLSVTPRLVVNDWLRLDVHAKGPTTWYVLPDPRTSPRPAMYMAFLRGNEEPDLRVRNDQGSRVGGGNIGPEEGNFEHDAIEYRVRHVAGASPAFTDAVFVSVGS